MRFASATTRFGKVALIGCKIRETQQQRLVGRGSLRSSNRIEFNIVPAVTHTPSTRNMAPLKKPAGQTVQAEVALQQSLKNCLVNLPSSLVSILVNANTVSIPVRIPDGRN
jgi:hypothetical protein